jgi:excisionase family DNA binding protein
VTGVTLQEVADLLGVHYMTAYRYVRLGLLPAEKVGGTWRVTRTTLEEFRSSAGNDAGLPASRRRAPWAERLEARLVAGDTRGAWGVVEAALASGSDLDDVYLDVIAPALVSIGTRWEQGEVDVALEHRASGIVLRLLGRLGPRFGRRGRTRGTVLLGAPAGERHSIPLAMVADLVRSAGWEVFDLGADVPVASFVDMARDASRLAAVGVSVTADASLGPAREVVCALREAVGKQAPILVGGRAVLDDAHAATLGSDGYAANGRSMVLLLDRLTEQRGLRDAPDPDRKDDATV